MAPARTRRQIHELPFSFIDCVRSFLHERSTATFPSPPVIDFGVEQQRNDVPPLELTQLGRRIGGAPTARRRRKIVCGLFSLGDDSNARA